jgi:diadenylate cyclase
VREWLGSLLDVGSFGWRDALDILLVALLVYGALALLRRTRGAPVAIGILGFIVIWRIVVALELQTLGTILDVLVAGLPLAIVLLFQNHIRRALMLLGRLPLLRFFSRNEEELMIESIALAAMSLASKRTGALIVIERAVGLRTYTDSGIPLDARPSYELLLALFHVRSPLHDGAVVISAGRIAAAACLLPLTTKPHLAGRFGSRHRAAIGLSEETDAFIIVVSEERGTISIVRDGEVIPREAKELRDDLMRELSPASVVPARDGGRRLSLRSERP